MATAREPGSTDATPAPGAARWVLRLAHLILLIGIVGACWGAAYAINGMTQAHATIKVQVAVAASEPQGWGNVQLGVPGVVVPDGWMAPAQVVGLGFDDVDGRLTLATSGSTRLEQLLGRGDRLVVGLGLLVGAAALRPVLISIASGHPFARHSARRLAVLAGAVAVTGTVAPWLPYRASLLVLERTGLAGSGVFSLAPPGPQWVPLLVGALALVLAMAFRAGERLVSDVEGLV